MTMNAEFFVQGEEKEKEEEEEEIGRGARALVKVKREERDVRRKRKSGKECYCAISEPNRSRWRQVSRQN